MFLRISLFTLFILVALKSHSQSEFSLEDCIDHAVINAWSTKENQLDIADAKAQIKEYRSLGLPQIEGSLDFQHYFELPTSIFPASSFGPNNPPADLEIQFGIKNNISAGIGVNTLLLDGSYLIGLKAIKRYLNLVTTQGNLNLFELKYMISESYYRALSTLAAEKILESNISNLEATLKETKAFYDNGFIEKLDVDRLELSLNNLLLQKDNQQKASEQNINALKFQMNYPMDEEITLKGELEDYLSHEAKVKNLKEIEAVPSQRPEFQILDATIVLRKMDLQRYKYSRLPSVVGFGSYTQQLQGDEISEGKWFPFSLLGAQLTIPIFKGFSIRSKIERAEIALDKIILDQNKFSSVVDLEVENAVLSIENARKSFTQRSSSLAQAQNIYDVTKIKFNEGVGSSFELTQAERELYISQANQLLAIYNLIIANMNLDKALGLQ